MLPTPTTDGERQEGETGRERAQPVDGLEIEAQDEDQAEQGQGADQGDAGRSGERWPAQEGQGQHRGPATRLKVDEGEAGHEARGQEPDDGRRPPAESGAASMRPAVNAPRARIAVA